MSILDARTGRRIHPSECFRHRGRPVPLASGNDPHLLDTPEHSRGHPEVRDSPPTRMATALGDTARCRFPVAPEVHLRRGSQRGRVAGPVHRQRVAPEVRLRQGSQQRHRRLGLHVRPGGAEGSIRPRRGSQHHEGADGVPNTQWALEARLRRGSQRAVRLAAVVHGQRGARDSPLARIATRLNSPG
jgi:hypothetical protein